MARSYRTLLSPVDDSATFSNVNINFFLNHQVRIATVPGMDGCVGMIHRLEYCPISTAQITFQTLIQQVKYFFLFHILL